jgi:deoxyribodipyrimidine photo-lyase
MTQETRIKALNKNHARKGDYVIYWMQASQRTEYNHALEYAVQSANERNQPPVVFFGLTDSYPDANERHYAFMLEGLREVKDTLEARGIQLIVRHGSPEKEIVDLARRASLVVVDRGYTDVQRVWRRKAARRLPCSFMQVESDAVVPVEVASPKEEYSARTLRAKLQRVLDSYLVPLRRAPVKKESLRLSFDSFMIDDPSAVLSRLKIDRSVPRLEGSHPGGTQHAKKRLREFIRKKLDRYDEMRNDPTEDATSGMSPYLHFGQISPLYIALKIKKNRSPGTKAYLEELIVRRELAMNYVLYNPRYSSFEGLPDWCRRTLSGHRSDAREYIYGLEEFEGALTHDPYWNAAQKEMVQTGKMQGYMRMYWGKKILEWTKTPEDAFQIALYLNNKYELDGRDPNGFTGVAWCFGKHDRPWTERKIFGTIRYMNDRGLRRKFDADGYVRKVDRLAGKETGSADPSNIQDHGER